MTERGVLSRLIREPLLHFAVLGAGVFALSSSRAEPPPERPTIVVPNAVLERIDAEMTKQLGRPPTAQERQASLDGWLDGELLYREGLALGLDRDDPMVRRRVIQKMEFVSTNLEVPTEPDDDTLRAFMAANADRYAGPPRSDFTLITVQRQPDEVGDARAQQLLDQLRGGAAPSTIDGKVATGRKFSAANTSGTYGPEIGAAVEALVPGQWGMVPFEGGWTFVGLDGRSPGATPPFEEIRNRVLLDWKSSQRGVSLRERIDEIRSRYDIQMPSAPNDP